MAKLPLTALVEDADLTLEEATHVLGAHTAIIDGNLFVYLSDGQLAAAPITVEEAIDWSLLTTVDMPDVFEHADLCRKARLMLDAATGAPNTAREQLRDAIQLGPAPVIGYDRSGDRQAAFNHGWGAAKDQIYREAKALGLLPEATPE